MKGLMTMRKRILSFIMSAACLAASISVPMSHAQDTAPAEVSAEDAEKGCSFDDVYNMTAEEVKALFAANNIENGKVWTAGTVSESIKNGVYPAFYLKPDKSVFYIEAWDDNGPNKIYYADFLSLYENYGLPENYFWAAGKIYERTDEEGGKYCAAQVIPIALSYDVYMSRLAAFLNYIQLTPDFAGFYDEDMSVGFYGQGADNEEMDMYNVPPEKAEDFTVDFIGDCDAWGVKNVMEANGVEYQKIWSKSDVSEMLKKGKFPSAVIKGDNFKISDERIQQMSEEDPEAVICLDDGIMWFVEKMFDKLGVPPEKYTMKLRTFSIDGEKYCKIAVIPLTVDFDKYVGDLTAVLNLLQFKPDFYKFDEEDVNEKFYENMDDEGLRNQYWIPDWNKYTFNDIYNMSEEEIKGVFYRRELDDENRYIVYNSDNVSYGTTTVLIKSDNYINEDKEVDMDKLRYSLGLPYDKFEIVVDRDGKFYSYSNDEGYYYPFKNPCLCRIKAIADDEETAKKLFAAAMNLVELNNDFGYAIVDKPATPAMKAPETVRGDANNDGSFNVSDVVILNRWLISADGAELPNWKAVDFDGDDRIDVFDLAIMKKELVKSF